MYSNDQAPLVRSLTEVDEVLTFCLSGLSKVAALAAVEARLDRDRRPVPPIARKLSNGWN